MAETPLVYRDGIRSLLREGNRARKLHSSPPWPALAKPHYPRYQFGNPGLAEHAL
jgi:hypothetical protein